MKKGIQLLKLPNAKPIVLPIKMRIGSNAIGPTWQVCAIDSLTGSGEPEWMDVGYVFVMTVEQSIRAALQFLMMKKIHPA